MANYYCDCSVYVPYDNDDEFVWLENEMRVAVGSCCTQCKLDETMCRCPRFSENEDTAGFLFVDQGEVADLNGRRAIWVHSDEFVNGEMLVDIIERFQREFHKLDFWECHFSHTCSKPRLDAFGGWGVLVHRGQAYYFCPMNQTTELITELGNLDAFEQTLPIHL